MIKAVFFDLDGVLINSEVQEHSWTKEYLDSNNIAIPIERFEMLIGTHKKQNVWKQLIKGYEDKIIDEESFKTGLRAYKFSKRDLFDYNQILFPDVIDYLSFLKKRNIKIACASSSNINYIKNALSKCQILEFFDLICTGDDFVESKPSPEIYLYCMNSFGLKPEECLVVEDSVFGIEAGKRANMFVIARKTPFSFSQKDANLIFDDINTTRFLFDEQNT